MEKTQSRNLIVQSLKAGVLAFIFSCAFVLLIALVAKVFNLNGHGLTIANEVFKLVSVGVAMYICVKDDNLLLKSTLGSLVFAVLSVVMFLLLGGAFNLSSVAVDFAVALIVAVVVCLFKDKISR